MKHASDPNRRTLLGAALTLVGLPKAAALGLECSQVQDKSSGNKHRSTDGKRGAKNMQIQYLEIVTKDVEAICTAYAQLHNPIDRVPVVERARGVLLTTSFVALSTPLGAPVRRLPKSL